MLLATYLASAFILLSLVVSPARCKFSVEITDPRVKINPGLNDASTVVYNNKIYVYGGAQINGQKYSNNMYVYEFFESNGSITLSLEDMNGSGPKCSSCGAVLLPNTSKMLVLSYDHDKVDNWGVNITNIPPVLPYVYDFETKQWSIETETPRLNANNQSTDIFGVRFGHNTVVGSNGMVYIIGGRSIWSGSGSARLACLTSTWYYNPEDHSYNALSVEAPWCFHYANAFSTPM